MKQFFSALAISVCMLTFSHSASAQKDSVRVTIFGDSYSTFEGYIPPTHEPWYAPEGSKWHKKNNDVKKVEQTWWWQVIDQLKWKLETNNSWSGSTVGYYGYRNENYDYRSFNTRVPYLGEPDVILCCCGTNDSWTGELCGEYKYANWTESDMWYFRPAFARMVSNIRQNYPTAKLYIIINSELKPEHTETMQVISKHYGVPCLLLHDIEKQGGHPSQAGMKAFAKQVVDFLKKNK
ncbi:MAG: hypothetical protein J5676_08665 [Bacteroidaceae bacterium]|nr:hypothetical protein [Bacteroidaceae bacterium]